MRGAVLFILIARASSAQVQNAADVSAGVYTTILAQGSLAVINYSQVTSTPVTSAAVSLLPVNSATPMPAQVTNVQPFTITFVVPRGLPTGRRPTDLQARQPGHSIDGRHHRACEPRLARTDPSDH